MQDYDASTVLNFTIKRRIVKDNMSSAATYGGRLPEETYIDLIRSLFNTLFPTTIMALSFATVGTLVINEQPDMRLICLFALGILAVVARLTVLVRYRLDARDSSLTGARASRMEHHFRIAYFSYAIIFGIFNALAYLLTSESLHAIIIALCFGYIAAVASGISLRPQIGVPSIMMATIPIIIATLSHRDLAQLVLSFLLFAFMSGGIQSMLSRYKITHNRITMSRSFSMMARRDHLTGLGNRLSLRESFEKLLLERGKSDIMGVHCLDLDRFKFVNDTFGHPVGDALLVAVGERLRLLLRNSDFAVRMGGDEFVVVQTQAKHPTEVEMLARRIVRTIAEPFMINDHEITIGTSVGYVISSDYGAGIDSLTSRADQALCLVKRQGGGVAEYDPSIAIDQFCQRLPAASLSP